MIDSRFYETFSPVSAEKLASAGEGSVVSGNPEHLVTSVASSSEATIEDLTFFDSESADAKPEDVRAGVCFSTDKLAARFPDTVTVVTSSHPRWSFSKAAHLVAAPRESWNPEVFVHADSVLEDGVRLGPNVVIGAAASIGAGTVIGPGVVVGPGVSIGRNCRIGANVSLSCAYIGDRVTVHPGAVIGEPGFGLSPGPNGLLDTPHYGRVIIQDDATIGSNCCIDRGVFDDTLIGQGAKLDNMCQIAHNVQIGAHSVLAAFIGLAGSSKLGQGVMLGGRVGVAEHTSVGDGVKLAAGAGVMHDVPPGVTWGGYPAKPMRAWMREVAWVARESQKRSK